MLKHFYKSPNGFFRLGTIPGAYPPGTTPRDLEERFGDPDEQEDRALRRREAEEDKEDEARKLRRLNKGRWDTRSAHHNHFGEKRTNNNERKQ
jgi:hypothetical protein